MNNVRVKICGIKDEAALRAAIDAGADFIGFVFFEKSSRQISPAQAAKICNDIGDVARHWARVALLVNPSDEYINEVVNVLRPDIIQLHGDEDKLRLLQIREIIGDKIQLMKCFAISTAQDVQAVQISDCLDVVDYLLFDAKPPQGSNLPGGNAASFDWTLLKGEVFINSNGDEIPWMLAGGLDVTNIARAIGQSGARMVDVSSGVEKCAGIKDADKIKDFITATKSAQNIF